MVLHNTINPSLGGVNMNNRVHTGDKFEVIDRESPYFGKTVIFIKQNTQHIDMLNPSGKTIGKKKEVHNLFKLEGMEDIIEFTANQLRKI